MSGNLQTYSLIFAVANGTLLAEEQQVDMRRTANAQIVNTVAKGFAGVSPGAAMTEVDVKNALPAGGFEVDFGDAIEGLIQVNVQILAAGKSVKRKAYILEDSIRHGVNQEASYDFKAVMSFAKFR